MKILLICLFIMVTFGYLIFCTDERSELQKQIYWKDKQIKQHEKLNTEIKKALEKRDSLINLLINNRLDSAYIRNKLQ